MRVDCKWRELGHRNVMWELLRYYLSLKGAKNKKRWIDELRNSNSVGVESRHFPIESTVVDLFFEYLAVREERFNAAVANLRSEEQAVAYCQENRISYGVTSTQSRDHHQASKSLVATVSRIAEKYCEENSLSVDTDPQQRCIWCSEQGLHVTARNLDGAIPSTLNPQLIWEIKEYWGKTKGGSKMSDAVYECHLVGRELRDFEERSRLSIKHVVFVDGKSQWSYRQSDMKRFIDLHHQGLIDELFVGAEVECDWASYLEVNVTI